MTYKTQTPSLKNGLSSTHKGIDIANTPTHTQKEVDSLHL